MGWFSPVKGSYPSLAQVDKALPVKTGVDASTVERGTILTLAADDSSADGAWDITDASADTKLLYVALQDYSDPTAGFAGDAFNPNGGVPKINAIDLAQDGEYETSVFAAGTYTVGMALMADKGVLKPQTGSNYIVGYVTRPPTDRWVNNAIAVPDQKKAKTDPRLAIRTGAKLSVLRFKTAV